MRNFRKFAAAAAATLGMLTFASPASATTFCVPDFFAACPDNGSNETRADIESAMNDFLSGGDGVADTIMLPAGTITDPDSFKASGVGTDDLAIVGAGRDQTFLTSSATSNSYVVDLVGNGRETTLKDLAIVIPESFPDGGGNGAGAQTSGDNFESVDLITRNDSSDGFANVMDGGEFTDVRIFGEDGDGFHTAFGSFSGGSGPIEIHGMEVEGAERGIYWSQPTMPVDIDGLTIRRTGLPISAINGADVQAANVLIESGSSWPVLAELYNSSDDTFLGLNHATIVATGEATMPAIRATVSNSASFNGSVQVDVRNSIVAGFDKTWDLGAPPVGSNLGTTDLLLAYSNYENAGDQVGDTTLNTAANIVGPPGFTGSEDFHLAYDSPLIDAGDPATDFLPPFDLEGNVRPADGDGDGIPVRDMGAFEFELICYDQSGCPPLPTCETDPTLCVPTCELNPLLCQPPADTTAPRVSRVKFGFKPRRGGSLRFRLSEEATVRAVFRPVPKKAKRGKKRKVVKITRRAQAGQVKVKLGKRRLKTGRYRLTVTATDKAGNRSKPVKKKVVVRKKRKTGS